MYLLYYVHYRYGLGMIYFKKEQYILAETHFKKAFSINSQSSVLLSHIGLVRLSTINNIALYALFFILYSYVHILLFKFH